MIRWCDWCKRIVLTRHFKLWHPIAFEAGILSEKKWLKSDEFLKMGISK